MKILAHRGCWGREIKANSSYAIRQALEKGFGFESDIRDYQGKAVIAHDMADETCQDAEEIFCWLREFGDAHCFAINIKADGLKEILKNLLGKYQILNYFLFDMSVPQMVEFREAGLRYFTRQSEVEKEPVLYQDAAGVWVDGFWSTDWITDSLLQKHMDHGKQICIVSPELHQDSHYRKFWKKLKLWNLEEQQVFLCTDYPEEATKFFNGC